MFKINYRFDGQKVESVSSTTYAHTNINQLASYLGRPLTTGGWNSGTLRGNHAKTEIMDSENGGWKTEADYPFYPM